MHPSVIISRLPIRRLPSIINRRLVSTSSKKNDTTVVADVCEKPTKVDQNWVSYGFNRKDKAEDRFWTHTSFFTTITLCMTIGVLYFAYMPDYSFREWAQREAFLELNRREKNGFPLIDPNLVDTNKIQLPSDEDLCDTEIII